MQNALSINFSEFVQIHNNQTVTTSEFIAKAFNKRHADVLRKIDELLTQVPDYFSKRNFAFTVKTSEQTFGARSERCCELTKDGFILLVMGFTGKQAMQIKIAYIEAFNAMAEKLFADRLKNPVAAITLPAASVQQLNAADAVNAMPSRNDLVQMVLLLGEWLKDYHNWTQIELDKYLNNINHTQDWFNACYKDLVNLVRTLNIQTKARRLHVKKSHIEPDVYELEDLSRCNSTIARSLAAVLTPRSHMDKETETRALKHALFELCTLFDVLATVRENQKYSNENQNIAEDSIETALLETGKLHALISSYCV